MKLQVVLIRVPAAATAPAIIKLLSALCRVDGSGLSGSSQNQRVRQRPSELETKMRGLCCAHCTPRPLMPGNPRKVRGSARSSMD